MVLNSEKEITIVKQNNNLFNEDIIIEFHNVSKKYKSLLALDNISFKVHKGDVFGYIGPNGAGKTTTIKILVGLIRDYFGDVEIYGRNIAKNKGDFHQFIGYHPQEAGFQEWRTVDHALKTFGRLSGLQADHLENRIQDVLNLLKLSDARYKKIIHLSSGMFQKLRLCQALLHEPEILVLDEPLSGLDPSSRYQFKNIIKVLANSGITIIFSSHILTDVQDIADKICILNQGRIMKIGTPEDLQNSFHIGNILRIEVAESSSFCKELSDLHEVENVEKISSNIGLIHLKSGIDIDLAIKTILNKFLAQNCKLRNFNLVKPSLEEVYLKYVGGGVP